MDGWMRLAGQIVLKGKIASKDGIFTVKRMVGTDSFYGATDGVLRWIFTVTVTGMVLVTSLLVGEPVVDGLRWEEAEEAGSSAALGMTI
jgi:hypothetical protein